MQIGYLRSPDETPLGHVLSGMFYLALLGAVLHLGLRSDRAPESN